MHWMKQQKETRSLNIDNEFLIFALYYPVLLITSNQLNEYIHINKTKQFVYKNKHITYDTAMYLMNRYIKVKVIWVKIVRSRGDPSSEDWQSGGMLRASLRIFSRWGHRVALTLLALSVCLYLNTLWDYLQVYRNEGTSYLPLWTVYHYIAMHIYKLCDQHIVYFLRLQRYLYIEKH